MKLLILSDLHGNYDALSALEEDWDQLWVLGDLVNYGPQPCEVVDWVRSRAAIVVRGNHDHAVGFGVDPRCAPRYSLMAETTRQVTDSVLTPEQKAYLKSLPLSVTVESAGVRFYLCHAMPSDPLFGYCPLDSERWVAEVEKAGADVVLTGHTHVPFVRTIGGRVLANPGSLGQPKSGHAQACYAVWCDGSLELRSVSYPVEATIEKLRRLPLPSQVQTDLAVVLRTGML
jgi:protein phosphatase